MTESTGVPSPPSRREGRQVPPLTVAREQAIYYRSMQQLAKQLDLPGGVTDAEAFVVKYGYTPADVQSILLQSSTHSTTTTATNETPF